MAPFGRAAELEAQLRAVEAESQALKREAEESTQRLESLRGELASLKVLFLSEDAVPLREVRLKLLRQFFSIKTMCFCNGSLTL